MNWSSFARLIFHSIASSVRVKSTVYRTAAANRRIDAIDAESREARGSDFGCAISEQM
jgi:hypothetical protein